MKTLHVLAASAAALLMVGHLIAGPVKPANKAVAYRLDVSKSQLHWTAKKITGEHMGTLAFKEGGLTFNGNKLTGGQFTVDMTSLVNTDLTDKGYNDKLVGHLNSDDFFSTAKHPTATFRITKLTPTGPATYQVTGDMTIKGITQATTFPATVKQTATGVEATGKLTLDRTKYDIKYGSKSFFEGLGDKAIYDDFDIDLKLVANR
ncbi:YceI family protein [Spirosoma utsteinense]|uniref:Polyisoprenoid-binding protein YceI n=1 Tax=Spirosoma utsteinense TaxID=2585773 RepID=A0ABR6WE53_9BACT|nr:YceI family protein [Spirosoma utsteinense]MBC3794814.1 polyisoprenoid-binding protein YceI [Spirosoma utsteinense]